MFRAALALRALPVATVALLPVALAAQIEEIPEGVEVPAFRASASAFYLQRASRITAPVLYGIGSGSIPRREPSQHYYQSLVPQTEVVVIPGVDHSMLTQGPKQVAEAVAEFLARHPL